MALHDLPADAPKLVGITAPVAIRGDTCARQGGMRTDLSGLQECKGAIRAGQEEVMGRIDEPRADRGNRVEERWRQDLRPAMDVIHGRRAVVGINPLPHHAGGIGVVEAAGQCRHPGAGQQSLAAQCNDLDAESRQRCVVAVVTGDQRDAVTAGTECGCRGERKRGRAAFGHRQVVDNDDMADHRRAATAIMSASASAATSSAALSISAAQAAGSTPARRARSARAATSAGVTHAGSTK